MPVLVSTDGERLERQNIVFVDKKPAADRERTNSVALHKSSDRLA